MWRTGARSSRSHCRGKLSRCSSWSGEMLRWRLALLVSVERARCSHTRAPPASSKALGEEADVRVCRAWGREWILGMPGDEDHRQLGLLLADSLDELMSAHSRHPNVGDEK